MINLNVKIEGDNRIVPNVGAKQAPRKTLERSPQQDTVEIHSKEEKGSVSEYSANIKSTKLRSGSMVVVMPDGRYFLKSNKVKTVSPLSATPKITSPKKAESPKSPRPEVCEYTDDGIIGIDGSIESASLREEMRERILSRGCLTDDSLQVKRMQEETEGKPQLSPSSKYYGLGTPRINKKNNQIIYICENLRDMPDMNGVRGKTPLFGVKNIRGFEFRMGKLKEYGIQTIIDLRSEGECSLKTRKALDVMGLKYVNFPVEDSAWTKETLDKVKDYIDAVNSGNFYVGCANGEARTDLAVSINYILNPKAKRVPELYFGSVSSSRVSIKQNVAQIMNLISENPDIVKEWGWNSYDEFMATAGRRAAVLLQTLKG